MNTFKSTPGFAAVGKTDFVSSDAAALASHMSRCATSRSRFFRLHAALETVHSMASPRIVTLAAFAVAFGVLFLGLVSIA